MPFRRVAGRLPQAFRQTKAAQDPLADPLVSHPTGSKQSGTLGSGNTEREQAGAQSEHPTEGPPVQVTRFSCENAPVALPSEDDFGLDANAMQALYHKSCPQGMKICAPALQRFRGGQFEQAPSEYPNFNTPPRLFGQKG